jgi:flagellar biosynthetic protein FlhB
MAPAHEDTGERTYPPTPLRLAEERRRGNVPRSADLAAAALLLGAVATLALLADRILGELTAMTAALLDGRQDPLAAPADLAPAAWNAAAPLLGALAPFALAVVLLAVLANVAQVGLAASSHRVRWDWGRLSVGAGLRRVVSGRSAARTAFAAAKLLAAGAVGYVTVREAMPRIAAAGRLAAGELASEATRLAYRLSLRLTVALFVLALGDWLYQRWRHRRDLRMTRREWLEDLRRMEGGNALRLRRRRRGAEGETTLQDAARVSHV